MRNAILVAAGAALIALSAVLSPAAAADLPLKAAPQPIPFVSQTFRWTGLYLGGAFGYETNNLNADIGAALGGGSLSTSPGGFSAGAVVEVLYELPSLPITVGAMAEIDRLFSNNSAQSWLGKAGPEIGWAVGSWLPYVRGGFAYQAFDNQFGGGRLTLDPKGDGWFVGLGVKYAWTPWLVTSIGWDHTDITGPSVNFTGLGNLLTTGSKIDQFLFTIELKG